LAASAGEVNVALSCFQAALTGASASHTKLVLPVVLVYITSSEVAALPMYQSDAAYFVFGLIAIGALIHFASPEDSALTVTPRLCVPVCPVLSQDEVAVFVPQLSNVQLAGLPDAAVSAEGLATRFEPSAWATSVGTIAAAVASARPPTSFVIRRTLRYSFCAFRVSTAYRINYATAGQRQLDRITSMEARMHPGWSPERRFFKIFWQLCRDARVGADSPVKASIGQGRTS
jgi:hypothetical protein